MSRRFKGRGYVTVCRREPGDRSMTFVSMFGQGVAANPPPLHAECEMKVCDLEPDYGRMSDGERARWNGGR